MSDTSALLNQALAGRYRIDDELGRGGMAVVFRARDLRHDRTVAIKVLHADLAAALGVERFLTEIRVTANLQHPNILPLLDSGAVIDEPTDTVSTDRRTALPFYVTPYVAGHSLRARLEREKQLPIADALRITAGVAAALEYAHKQGVIHRDIKPENILLQDGQPVVADFGIALAVTAAASERLTQTGLSLGTPHYMSPEQAMGERHLDVRTDVYALGVVLYEMLAGEPPFVGPNAPAVVARVLTEKPRSLAVVRETVPIRVERAVERALQKLPADRFASIAAFASAVDGDAAVGAEAAGARRETSHTGAAPERITASVPWAVAAVALAVAGWSFLREPTSINTEQWDVATPDTVAVAAGIVHGTVLSPPAISNDGTLLAFSTRRDTTSLLYVARLGKGEVVGLSETQGARAPFFSPDGKWVGFFVGNQIRRAEIATGRVTVVSDGIDGTIATWTDGKKIAFVDDNGYGWVSEAGGSVHRLRSAGVYSYVAALPNDRVIIADLDGRICVVSLGGDSIRYLTTGRPSTVPPPLDQSLTGVWARYLTAGFLVFWRPGAITYVVPFDQKSLAVRGVPVEVRRGIRAAFAAVAPSGVLAYAPDAAAGARQLAELGAGGIIRTLPIRARRYSDVELSRDGRRVALRLTSESGAEEVVVHDLGKPGMPIVDRIPVGRGNTVVWERSGRFLYADSVNGAVYRRDLKTGALDSVLVPKASDEAFYIVDVIGADTLVANVGPAGDAKAYLIPFHEPRRRIRLVSEVGKDQSAWSFSSDAKWLLYQVKNGANYDNYVLRRGSPEPGDRWQDVSSGFRWGADGQLYFFRGDSILRAPVSDNTGGPVVASANATFVALNSFLDPETWAYVPMAGGRSVLAFVPLAAGANHHLTVVRHWERELARLVR